MQIYWLVMSGLLLFPWSVVIVPTLAGAYRRRSSGAQRRATFKHIFWISLALFTVLAGAGLAYAAEPAVTPLERLHDGVLDLATGWTRIFRAIAVETAERGPVGGFLVGSVEGSHQALRQTTHGAYETATFFLPVPRPHPMPTEPGHLLEVPF